MSFIYDDPNLVAKLLMDGLEFKLKFTKRGQVAAASMSQDRANLLAMVKGLQSALDPNQSQAPKIAWEGDQQPTLASPNLESLGDLVHWLVESKITVNGQRVAYDDNENPNQRGWVLYRLETHVAGPEQRGQTPGGYFVNPNLLKIYITQLQAYESQNPNPTMRFQLGKLIEEANTDLGVGLNAQYQAPEKVLRDTVVLDNVPDTFVNAQSSSYGGDVPLTYGDLKDEMTFSKWLKDHSIQFLANLENKPVKVMVGAPGFDLCAILKILMYRATHQVATSPEEKEKSQIYARQISAVAKAANCDLSGQASAPGAADMQGGQNKQQGQGNQQRTSDEAALISQIINRLPLQLQNIDFNRIKTFFSYVGQLMSNNPTVMGYIQNTQELMTKASDLTKQLDTFFQLGISPQALVNMLKPNERTGFPAANFPTLVQTLDQIIDNTRAVVGYFMSQYANKLNPDERAYIFGQIGRRPDDTSIYSRNIEYLNQWLRTPHN